MIRFTKMHGNGNDYIVINGFEQSIDDPSELSIRISDRHTGVGSDGLILMLPPDGEAGGDEADLKMRIFNADGSEAEMCGNGIRCVCKYAYEYGLSDADPMRIQTGAGVLALEYTRNAHGLVELVTVDMGEPEVSQRAVSIDDEVAESIHPHHVVEFDEAGWVGVFVSMGNPHVVMFSDEHPELMAGPLADFDLARWGPRIENHPTFPHRINVHFVEVTSKSEITMRTWERGSGITQACGTGACAVGVAGVITGRTQRDVLIHLPGGDLNVRWDEPSNHVFMTGPATEVFSGEWGKSQMAGGR